MRLTEILPTNYLLQKDPMLMIDKIIKFTKDSICIKPKIPKFWIKEGCSFDSWIILEILGQTSELLWRLNGINGKGYLIKIENFLNFDKYDKRLLENLKITAVKKGQIGNFYLSHAEILNEKATNADFIHYFE